MMDEDKDKYMSKVFGFDSDGNIVRLSEIKEIIIDGVRKTIVNYDPKTNKATIDEQDWTQPPL